MIYHWYVDGVYAGTTYAGEFCAHVDPGDTLTLSVAVTLDPADDPLDLCPEEYPGRRTLEWLQPSSGPPEYYRIDHATTPGTPDPGDWTEYARVSGGAAWSRRYLTGPLADLTPHWFRIVPIDEHGDEGAPVELGPEQLVRRPDRPDVTVTFDDGTQRITVT